MRNQKKYKPSDLETVPHDWTIVRRMGRMWCVVCGMETSVGRIAPDRPGCWRSWELGISTPGTPMDWLTTPEPEPAWEV